MTLSTLGYKQALLLNPGRIGTVSSTTAVHGHRDTATTQGGATKAHVHQKRSLQLKPHVTGAKANPVSTNNIPYQEANETSGNINIITLSHGWILHLKKTLINQIYLLLVSTIKFTYRFVVL